MTPVNALTMTHAEFAAACAALVGAPCRAAIVQRDTASLASLHACYPETAAAADATARTAAPAQHREMAPCLIRATLDLRQADAAAKESARFPSALERDQVDDCLAAAVLHGTVLVEVQAVHAAAYGAA